MRTLIFFISLFGFSFSLQAQMTLPEDVRSDTQLKAYVKSALRNKDFHTAVNFYNEFLVRNPENLSVRRDMADLYRQMNAYDSAADNYALILSKNPDNYPELLYYLGDMLMQSGRYDTAKVCFDRLLAEENVLKNPTLLFYLSKKQQGCELALSGNTSAHGGAIKHLSAVNNLHLQSSPMLFSDEFLVYASVETNDIPMASEADTAKAFLTDFYAARITADGRYVPANLPAPFINLGLDNVANACFSTDGNRMYFTARETNFPGKTLSRLYVRKKIDGKWLEPEILANHINVFGYNSTQPSVAVLCDSDVEILYFVSDKPQGAMGGFDIWYTVYNAEKDEYTEPKNAGPALNTPGNEYFPFFEKETGDFYYSSDGRIGFGGADIYKTQGSLVTWAPSQNLGSGINSPQNDLAFVRYSHQGKTFFISNRDESMDFVFNNCCYDIFEYSEEKADITVYAAKLYGQRDDNSIVPLDSAVTTLCINNPVLNQYICYTTDTTNAEGEFSFTIQRESKYKIKVEKSGYLTDEILLDMNNQAADSLLINQPVFKLKAIPKGSIRMENIYFEFNDYTLKAESKEVLNKTLLRILELNPGLVIEIAAHTDHKGTARYNMRLSEKRAKSVTDYLTEQGIDPKRLKAVGYGMTAPVAPAFTADGGDNPEGRQLNRRVEFKVIATDFQGR